MTTPAKNRIRIPDLSEKTVVITGASSGAGRATAIEFARHGAKIVLAARNEHALNDVAAECRELDALALPVKTDVTRPDEMKRLAALAHDFGGSIDVWVNNAGVLSAGTFETTPIEIHDQVIRTNLMGYLHGAHAVLPYFKRQQHGILVNNISVGGWIPVPYSVGYSASKYGLCGFSEALRGELGKYPGIHVCDLFPAFLDTPGIQHAANYTGHLLQPAPPVYDPQRVARAIVKLAVRPKDSVTIGSAATMLRLANALFPKLTRSITAKSIETYLKTAHSAHETSGNLFAPAEYGTSIHGGWNSPADMEIRKNRLIKTAVVTGLATAMLVFGGKQLAKKMRS